MYKQVASAPIKSINEIAPNIYDVWVESEYLAKNAKPGQFLHIKCADDLNTLLRRPISICDVTDTALRFIFEAKGEGTRLLANKKAGETLNILGPLGHGFDVEPDQKAVIIGGGIGTFPLLYLARTLKNPKLFMGYRNKSLVTLEEEFRSVGDLQISTDDGSYGYHGFVTDLAKKVIPECDVICACGPSVMLKTVQAIAKEFNKPSQLSMEQRMGCGIGACLVCVCKTVDGYGKVCQHGPVFDGNEVVF